jgi:DNA-binding transcriptional regulator YiaG
MINLEKSTSADNMLQYLPMYLRTAQEIKASLESIGHEIDQIKDKSLSIIDDAYILSASEERIQQWEQKLKIEPKGTLDQRKMFLLAVLRGQGKLNESKIKSVVKAFTGGDCTVTFDGSIITVKILAPAYGDVYLFPDVERSLTPRIPVHIGLKVQRWYASWNDIKENLNDWNEIKSLSSWKDLKDFLPSNVGS